MNALEQEDLKRICERLRRNISQAKMDNRHARNVYSWGLADGLEIAYDAIKAYYDKYYELKNMKPIGVLPETDE